MSYESNILATDHFFAGEDKTLSYEVFAAGSTSLMEDVGSFTLSWVMKNLSSTLTKTSASGITVTGTYNSARATNTQRVIVAIADTDTEGFTGGTYKISLKRTDTGVESVLSHGEAYLLVASQR